MTLTEVKTHLINELYKTDLGSVLVGGWGKEITEKIRDIFDIRDNLVHNQRKFQFSIT